MVLAHQKGTIGFPQMIKLRGMSWYSPAAKMANVSSCVFFYKADIANLLLCFPLERRQ
jgi:hypothetical protein